MNIPNKVYVFLVDHFGKELVDSVQVIFVERLPLWPFTSKADGLTLGNKIYLKSQYQFRLEAGDPAAVELLCHEMVHAKQFSGDRFWFLTYLFGHGRMESVAYALGSDLRKVWEFGNAVASSVMIHANILDVESKM